jgi:hypothetical protein
MPRSFSTRNRIYQIFAGPGAGPPPYGWPLAGPGVRPCRARLYAGWLARMRDTSPSLEMLDRYEFGVIMCVCWRREKPPVIVHLGQV